MADDTHRYDGSKLYRADGTLVENGETLTPTDDELKAFGDTLTAIRAKSRDEGTESANDADEEDESTPPESRENEGADGEVSEAQDEAGNETSLTQDQEALADYLDDPTDYGQVRSLAASTDGVKGNASQEEMTAQLAEKARAGEL